MMRGAEQERDTTDGQLGERIMILLWEIWGLYSVVEKGQIYSVLRRVDW